MNPNVLREFLISLGFHIDDVGMKKFTTAVEGVTKGVMAAGVAVAGTAAGIIAGVKIISNQMENLYYASQRTGETVGNLMALRYAAGQIGLTAGQAQGAIENFTRALRLNPGSNSLLQSLGVTGDNPTAKLESFVSKLKGMQPYVAAAYAGIFGIDPDTLLMLENGLPKLQDEQDKYQERLSNFGIDPQRAATSGKDFNNSIRRITSNFELLWVVIESKLVPVLDPLINKFERWSESHAAQVANGIAKAVELLGDAIGAIDWDKLTDGIDSFWETAKVAFGIGMSWLNDLWKTLVSMFRNNTGYIRTILEFLFVVPEALIHHWSAVRGFFSWMWSGISDAFSSAWSYISPIVDKLKSAVQWIENSWLGKKIAGLMSGAKTVADTVGDLLDKEYGYTPGGHPELDSGEVVVSDPASRHPELGDGEQYVSRSSSRRPRGIRNNNPGNLKYGEFAVQNGAVGKDGGGFAVFDSMQAGIAATLQLLRSYVSRGYDTIRTIISRWAPTGDNNTAAYIAAVAKRLGISADQKLSGDNLAGVAQSIFSHENGTAYGNLGALTDSVRRTRLGANAAPSGLGMALNQTNTFNITGSADPQGTARAVGAEQSRVNGDLVRNFAGAVQ